MAKLSISHPLVISLTLGVGLSVVAALFVGHWQLSNQRSRFQRQIDNLTTALQRSLNRYTDVLAFLGDYYRVSNGQVNRLEFEQFSARSRQLYPGIQALEWAPLVSHGERSAFEQRIQQQGYPHFHITELGPDYTLVVAAERPYYIPVTYIAPMEGNEVAFGFDLRSNPARTTAIEAARDRGTITATSPIRLVQEQRDQYGFLVFLPLYQSGTLPTDLASRRQGFEGFLLGVFRVSDVVEESLQDLQYDIDFVLYDQGLRDDPGNPTPEFLGYYDSPQQRLTTQNSPRVQPPNRQPRQPAAMTLCPMPTSCTHTLTVGDRQWQVSFVPSPSYPSSSAYGTPITLLVGLLLTGSFASLLYNLNRELVGAKHLNHLKLRFFSMASHELRTPLSTILLSAESLQLHYQDWSEDQKRVNIQRICLTAKRMGQQITDMLTLTRSEVGKLDFNPELVAVDLFCRQIITDLEVSTSPRITLIGLDPAITAFWDKSLVRSLMTNLVTNALKYSPAPSPVTVTLQAQADQVMITVSDQGRGIPATERQAVQEAFVRGSNVDNISGTGLGLAVVNTCIAMHRGQWMIDSTEGEGTTVSVTLPLD